MLARKVSEVPTCSGLDLKIKNVYLNASDERCISLAQETDKDEVLVALKNKIIKGLAKDEEMIVHAVTQKLLGLQR